MKALTIKQPWANLIIKGLKKYEFRSWRTKYRGPLLIHAGKGTDNPSVVRLKEYLPNNLPTGEIIGQVNVVDCIEVTKEFKEKLLLENKDIYKGSEIGSYAWKLDNVVIFDKQIAINGKLSLWEYEGDVV